MKATQQDAVIERKEERIIRLEKLVADFKRVLFGAKSEKFAPEQYQLALEDIETAIATIHAEDEDIDPPKFAKPCRANHGALPKHLPRIEEVLEPEGLTCSRSAERHIIGEDTSERLDIIPAQFRVIATRRPKYTCRACENGIVQVPAKPRLIEGGLLNGLMIKAWIMFVVRHTIPKHKVRLNVGIKPSRTVFC